MRFSLFALLVALGLPAFAQLDFNSTYSRFGVGNSQPMGLTHNLGMADVGVAHSNLQFVNLVNPALLQRTKFTSFDFGFRGEIINLNTGQEKAESSDLTLNQIVLAFPISNRFVTAFGLAPFSSVNYNISTAQEIASADDDEALSQYQGRGGLNRIFFSNAYRVVNDTVNNNTFSLGLDASFLMGRIEEFNSTLLTIDGQSDGTRTGYLTEEIYRGFLFEPGFVFRHGMKAGYKGVRKDVEVERRGPFLEEDTLFDYNSKEKVRYVKEIIWDRNGDSTHVIGYCKARDFRDMPRRVIYQDSLVQVQRLITKNLPKHHSGVYWNLGGAFRLASRPNVDTRQSIERLSSSGALISSDTILVIDNDLNGQKYVLPFRAKFGISFDKPVPHGRTASGERRTSTWSLGLDAIYEKWTDYAVYGENQGFEDTWRLALGGEWSPDILADKNIFRRSMYRAGLYYATLPYTINDTRIKELGITFGWSMPVGLFGRNTLPKYVNFAFSYSNRGTTDNGLVDEHYYRGYISFTLNDRRFKPRKIGL